MYKTFETWFAECDRVMWKIAGLGVDDLEDWEWYGAYEGGTSPTVAVRRALRNAGWAA